MKTEKGIQREDACKLVDEKRQKERGYYIGIATFEKEDIDWCLNIINGVRVGLIAIVNVEQHCMNRVMKELFSGVQGAIGGECFLARHPGGMVVIDIKHVSEEVDLFTCEQIEEALDILKFHNIEYEK